MEHKERWLPVVGYEGLYEVSDYGRVKSLPRIRLSGLSLPGKILSPGSVRSGYQQVGLYKDGRIKHPLIHRLVLEAFVGPCPDGMQACHYPDATTSNNRLSNLRWGTPVENAHDRKLHGRWRAARGERAGPSKRTERQIEQMFEMRREGMTCGAIAKHFKADPSCVSRALRGIEWAHVYERMTAGERS